MKKRYGKMEVNDMYCTCCGNKGIFIPRSNGGYREGGHLKKLYCIHCKDEVNHVEIRASYTKQDFDMEYRHGNFVNGERVNSTNQIRAMYRNESEIYG